MGATEWLRKAAANMPAADNFGIAPAPEKSQKVSADEKTKAEHTMARLKSEMAVIMQDPLASKNARWQVLSQRIQKYNAGTLLTGTKAADASFLIGYLESSMSKAVTNPSDERMLDDIEFSAQRLSEIQTESESSLNRGTRIDAAAPPTRAPVPTFAPKVLQNARVAGAMNPALMSPGSTVVSGMTEVDNANFMVERVVHHPDLVPEEETVVGVPEAAAARSGGGGGDEDSDDPDDPDFALKKLRVQLTKSRRIFEDILNFDPATDTSDANDANKRLQQMMDAARETRMKLSEEAPDVWAPVHAPGIEERLSRVLARAGQNGLEAFSDDPKSLAKIKSWLESEKKRDTFLAQNPDFVPEVCQDAWSQISVYDWSVSQAWNETPVTQQMMAPPKKVTEDPSKIWEEIERSSPGFVRRSLRASRRLVTNSKADQSWVNLPQMPEMDSDIENDSDFLPPSPTHVSKERISRRNSADSIGATQASGGTADSQTTTEVVQGIINDMEQNPQDSRVQYRACKTLSRFRSPDALQVFGDLGGIQLLLKAMQTHSKAVKLLHMSCCLASRVLEKAPLRSIFIREDGVRVLLTTLRAWKSNHWLQAQAIHSFAVGASDPSFREQLVKHKAFSSILGAMEVHHADMHVQHVGCWLMATLCASDKSIRGTLGELGAGPRILAAIIAHDSQPELNNHALRALVNLTIDQKICGELVADGACQAILNTMAKNVDHEEMQAAACWALAHLSMIPEGRRDLIASNAVKAILAIMHRHDAHAIQNCGCWVLSNLAAQKVAQTQVGEHGLEIVLKAIQNYPTDPELCAFACRLFGLVTKGVKLGPQMSRSIGDAVTKALSMHSDTPNLEAYVNKTLANLAEGAKS